jgi:hypothetical protein
MSRVSERGEGKLKVIITLAVIVAAIYLAAKIVPVYINNFELEDTMKTEARFGFAQRKPPEQVRETVYRKAQELGLPVGMQDIQVEAQTSGYRIVVTYTVIVELPGYQLQLDFQPTVDSMSI